MSALRRCAPTLGAVPHVSGNDNNPADSQGFHDKRLVGLEPNISDRSGLAEAGLGACPRAAKGRRLVSLGLDELEEPESECLPRMEKVGVRPTVRTKGGRGGWACPAVNFCTVQKLMLRANAESRSASRVPPYASVIGPKVTA
jgi:hypothetical protein